MQPITDDTEESSFSAYPCSSSKRTMLMLPPSQHHPQNIQQHRAASESTVFNGGDDDDGGGPIFCTSGYQVASYVSDFYNAAAGGDAATAVLPRTWHPFSSSPEHIIRGGMPLSSKGVFTTSQRQELERQTMICKYMMASVPVPPQLLFPFSKHLFPVSQSSTSGVDVKFSIGSDPEPWRCRRTDGKKWRCSRNVTPNQKYCERHAHKSRPRSRKPVETTQSHQNAVNQPPSLGLPINTSSSLPLGKQIAQFHAMGSASPYGHTRGIEWFSKGSGGAIPVSACNQQWQQLMHSSSSRLELNSEHNKEGCNFQPQYGDKNDSLTLMPCMDDAAAGKRLHNHQQQQDGRYYDSFLQPKMAHLPQTTRHFIDAWSTAAEKGGGLISEISKKGSDESCSSMKLPLSSLTLSMPGGNEINEENEPIGMMMELARNNNEEDMKSQWLNQPVTWMGTTPGGPLGEALCLGIATGAKGASNLPSPHGYSNSTTTSSSCEDGGSQALNFIS